MVHVDRGRGVSLESLIVLPYLENHNFPIPASFPFCNITRNLIKLLFRMHMQFAYVFVLFCVDPSLQNEKKMRGKLPNIVPRALYDPRLPKKKTNKQNTNKNLERKTNIDLLKWSRIAPFTSIFSPKYIYRRERSRTPICRREHDPFYKTGNSQAMNLRAPYQRSL